MNTTDKAPVPIMELASFIQWIEQGGSPLVEIGNYQLVQATNLKSLYPIVAEAYNKKCIWILMDGPRQQRPQWLLDPWWDEEPEMSVALQKATQAHKINIPELFEFLTEKFQTNNSEFDF